MAAYTVSSPRLRGQQVNGCSFGESGECDSAETLAEAKNRARALSDAGKDLIEVRDAAGVIQYRARPTGMIQAEAVLECEKRWPEYDVDASYDFGKFEVWLSPLAREGGAETDPFDLSKTGSSAVSYEAAIDDLEAKVPSRQRR